MYMAARSVALVACPIGFLTFALATPLITTVYGQQWAAAAAVLRILSLYGVIFVMCLLFVNIVIAMGRTGSLLAVQVIALISLLPAMALGIRLFGLVGIGVAHIAVISVVSLPIYLLAIRRSTGVSPVLMLRGVTRPIVSAGAGAVAALGMASLMQSPLLQLLVGGMAGILVYGVLISPILPDLLPASVMDHRVVGRAFAAVDRVASQLTLRGLRSP